MSDDTDADVPMRDATTTSSAMDITSIVNPSDSEPAKSTKSPSNTSVPTSKSPTTATGDAESLTSKSEEQRARALLEEKFADQVRDLKQKLDRINVSNTTTSTSTSSLPSTTTNNNNCTNNESSSAKTMSISSLINPPPSATTTTTTTTTTENPFLSTKKGATTSSTTASGGSGGGGLSSFAELLASLNEEMANQPDDVVERAGDAVEGILRKGSLRDNDNGTVEDGDMKDVDGDGVEKR